MLSVYILKFNDRYYSSRIGIARTDRHNSSTEPICGEWTNIQGSSLMWSALLLYSVVSGQGSWGLWLRSLLLNLCPLFPIRGMSSVIKRARDLNSETSNVTIATTVDQLNQNYFKLYSIPNSNINPMLYWKKKNLEV